MGMQKTVGVMIDLYITREKSLWDIAIEQSGKNEGKHCDV